MRLPAVARSAPHALRATGTNNGMVCGRGGWAAALADGGVVKWRLCMRVCKHTRNFSPAMCHACISEGVRAPLPTPSPLSRHAPDSFYLEPTHARLAAYPSASLPFILSFSLDLSLCLPLVHLVLTRCSKETPTTHQCKHKASAQNIFLGSFTMRPQL